MGGDAGFGGEGLVGAFQPLAFAGEAGHVDGAAEQFQGFGCDEYLRCGGAEHGECAAQAGGFHGDLRQAGAAAAVGAFDAADGLLVVALELF